ncbi:MAG: hypothetical protein BWY92_01109 [Firmicutes bacterium ADurb.BinA052]|nr:MAG: hypothetical protein BWY92_01109 [Firmicutes bacterium ADurb.BinA052]
MAGPAGKMISGLGRTGLVGLKAGSTCLMMAVFSSEANWASRVRCSSDL